MLKIGVAGAGHLGKIHIKILRQADFVDFVGFFDAEEQVRNNVSEEFGIKAFATLTELIEHCDVVDVVTPTTTHFEVCSQALRKRKHVFVEKPIASSIEESSALIKLAEEANVQVQVGHVERFNPAFLASMEYLNNPMFIETHRLAVFNPRGTDVSVVLDLMIHDIDAVLSVVNSEIKSINASGVAVVSETPDIANARVEFVNGCVANLTASRISMKNMRKSRFFQRDAYIAVDFLDKSYEIIKLNEVTGEESPFDVVLDLGNKGKKQISVIKESATPNNAIEQELKTFITAIENSTKPIVSMYDGHKALQVALEITQKMGI
jgi:predicted dehydrogenase